MTKKDFSFHYDIKTKTGTMTVNEKYIDLNSKISIPDTKQSPTGSSGGVGYGINLI